MRRLEGAGPDTLLWEGLQRALPLARFRPGVPIGPYVAGFLSRAAGLIVEVDSGRGEGPRAAARTRFLNGQGYRLIRFREEDVVHDLAAVLDALACALPPDLLGDEGPVCRIGPAAARAEWSPRPDLPARTRRRPAMHESVR